MSPDERQSIVATLDEETAAEAIAELDERLQTQVVEKLDPERAADIIEEMNPDEAADLMQNLEPETSREVLEEMDTREASDVESLLNFGPDTAGGMMNTEIVVVGEDATRGEVIDYVRFHEIAPDQLDNIVLINREAKLAGTVPIARLVLAARETSAWPTWRLSRCFPSRRTRKTRKFLRSSTNTICAALVVVNEENCPIGAITVDDVVSRMREKL